MPNGSHGDGAPQPQRLRPYRVGLRQEHTVEGTPRMHYLLVHAETRFEAERVAWEFYDRGFKVVDVKELRSD
jgi:hypothetical protein